jgi:4-amino-4-deoxy-L-arabinose transferase-like glycosyltransferase
MTDTQHNESPTLFIPERSLREWGIALLLFLLSILYLWPLRDYTIAFIDEGIVIQGAQRILYGEVLYRDFFSFYTPGTYYWLAALFKVFGSSFLVARTPLAIYGGLFSLITYLLARRICGRWMAILAAYLFLVLGLPYMFVVLHNWDSSILAYLALYCGVRFIEDRGRAWALAVGTLAALTCLFEQSKGTGLVLGLGLGFLLVATGRGGKGIVTWPHVAALLAGFTWPWVVTFAYFGFHQALPEMVADWLWPLSHYSGANRLPYGYINIPQQNWEPLYGTGSWLRRLMVVLLTGPCFILPVLPFVGLGVLILTTLRSKRSGDGDASTIHCVFVSAVAIGLFVSVLLTQRPEFDHLLYVSPPLFVVVAWVLNGRLIRSRLLNEIRPLLVVFLLFVFTAFGLILLLRGPWGASERIPTRRGVIRMAKPDPVIPYLQAHTRPGQTIFVYPYDPLYYFLSGTRSPTRFDYLQLGMHTPDQFAQALADLGADSTKLVLWNLSFNTEIIVNGWPATPLAVLAADPVRDFILSRYRPCTTMAATGFRYVILVRGDLPCPE